MAMTKAEIAEFLAQRRQAGLQIDAETAEIEWGSGNIQDPYGIGEDPEGMGCSGKLLFARAPGSDVWVYVEELPKTTAKALLERIRRATPGIEERERSADAAPAAAPQSMTADWMDDKLKHEFDHYNFVIEDAKRYFGEWDIGDPVSWAIIRVVQAQNDLAHAISEAASYGAPERMVEAAITERREAIAALQRAFERQPRGFQ
jgi:hypothetical protein